MEEQLRTASAAAAAGDPPASPASGEPGGSRRPRAPALARMAAVAGAMLRNAGAVVEDLRDFEVAEAICNTLAEADASGGLPAGRSSSASAGWPRRRS